MRHCGSGRIGQLSRCRKWDEREHDRLPVGAIAIRLGLVVVTFANELAKVTDGFSLSGRLEEQKITPSCYMVRYRQIAAL